MNKRSELITEVQDLFGSRWSKVLDAVLPPGLYALMFQLEGLELAWTSALIAAAAIAAFRLVRRENLGFVFGGAAAVLLTVLLVAWTGKGEDFFLPGLVSGAFTIGACVFSALLNRPLVALSSALLRRWPLAWYWHPQVLPAYRETTIAWAFAYALRLSVEFWLYLDGAVAALGVMRIIFGWPFLIALLLATYVYGRRRLMQLGGPSVDEFRQQAPPPWQGQQRGF